MCGFSPDGSLLSVCRDKMKFLGQGKVEQAESSDGRLHGCDHFWAVSLPVGKCMHWYVAKIAECIALRFSENYLCLAKRQPVTLVAMV